MCELYPKYLCIIHQNSYFIIWEKLCWSRFGKLDFAGVWVFCGIFWVLCVCSLNRISEVFLQPDCWEETGQLFLISHHLAWKHSSTLCCCSCCLELGLCLSFPISRKWWRRRWVGKLCLHWYCCPSQQVCSSSLTSAEHPLFVFFWLQHPPRTGARIVG